LLMHVGAEKHGTVEAAHQFANWELSGYYGCTLATRWIAVVNLIEAYIPIHRDGGSSRQSTDWHPN
jgi:hypothetical protein